jgi:hypothetical protein
MTPTETFIVSAGAELNTGDEIEARYRGVLVHRGRVTDLAPIMTSFGLLMTSPACVDCWTLLNSKLSGSDAIPGPQPSSAPEYSNVLGGAVSGPAFTHSSDVGPAPLTRVSRYSAGWEVHSRSQQIGPAAELAQGPAPL